MKIYLGGHLNFYHPQKDKWLEFKANHPMLLSGVLDNAGIPLGEVHLVVINGEKTDLQKTVISEQDEIKLFSAVGGG